jgi:hypothetical protein
MNEAVHVPAEHFVQRVAKHARCSLVDERATAGLVDAINPFSRGFEKQQPIFGKPLPFFVCLFAIGNIRGDAAKGVTVTLGIEQGKFDDQAGMGSVVMQGGFFEFHRRSSFQDVPVITAKGQCLFGWKDFFVGLADELSVGKVEDRLKPSVDLEIASLHILDENQGRAIVHDGPEPLFAFTQGRFRMHTLADIANDARNEQL